jgi:hypothetical protein
MPPSGPPATQPSRRPQALGGVATPEMGSEIGSPLLAFVRTAWTPR